MKQTYTNTYFNTVVVVLLGICMLLHMVMAYVLMDSEISIFLMESSIVVNVFVLITTFVALLLPKVNAEKYVQFCLLFVFILPVFSVVMANGLSGNGVFKLIYAAIGFPVLWGVIHFSKDTKESTLFKFNWPWLMVAFGVCFLLEYLLDIANVSWYISKQQETDFPFSLEKVAMFVALCVLMMVIGILLKTKKLPIKPVLLVFVVLLLVKYSFNYLVSFW